MFANRLKLKPLLALVLALLLGLQGACVAEAKATTGITLEVKKVTITIGDTYSVPYTLAGEAPDPVTLKSSKPAVVQVINDRDVLALKAGKSKITVKSGAKKAVLTVTVKAPDPESVTIDAGEISLKKGETRKLTATVLPAAANQKVGWKSSDKKIATVNAKGVVKGKGAGECVITCTTKTEQLTATATVTVTAAPTPTPGGNTITLGRYEQDNNPDNGPEPIKWQVLKKSGNSALVISKLCLDAQRYNGGAGSLSWSNCSLRFWLNDEFLNAAFTEKERAAILTTRNENPPNPEYGTDGGAATEDRLFLLSYQEADSLFASAFVRRCVPTAYALARGVNISEDLESVYWWLRSPGFSRRNGGVVDHMGFLAYTGCDLLDHLAVRPAMWINTSLL